MKKMVILIILIPFLFGCSKKEEKQYPEIYEQQMNGESWKVTETHNCDKNLQLYFSKDNSNVYFLCINEVFIKKEATEEEETEEISLKNYFGTIYENMDESIKKLVDDMELIETYKDGEVQFYKKENLILVKMNSLDGNRDVYFLPERYKETIKRIIEDRD